jgi:hypothetical protein
MKTTPPSAPLHSALKSSAGSLLLNISDADVNSGFGFVRYSSSTNAFDRNIATEVFPVPGLPYGKTNREKKAIKRFENQCELNDSMKIKVNTP